MQSSEHGCFELRPSAGSQSSAAPLLPGTAARAKELTGNFGVDVVLDVSAGAIEPLVQAVEIVRPGGRIVLAGLKNGRTLEGLAADKLILKEITLEGVLSSSWSAWFIDDDYNDTSFFVRHAYFLGGKDSYEKLKTALKTEIDEDAWSVLYSKVSRPFEAPQSGKIAVKVINHYGDEVMKVYDIRDARGA